MKHDEQLTIIGIEKIDTLNYDIFYLEDGVKSVIRIVFTDAPTETSWSLEGTEELLDLSGRKRFVARNFFDGCVRAVLGKLALPATFSA